METGKIIFKSSEISESNAENDEDKELRAAITAYWDRYLHMDAKGLTALMAPDVLRMSQRAGALQKGPAAIAAALPAEWEAFERPEGVIVEEMTVRSAEFTIQGKGATTLYWMEIEGGSLWDYTDQGLVFQAWEKTGGAWHLTHHLDAWSLDYDLDEEEPGEAPTFTYDYAYPVADLARAVAFYTPILGQPEAVTKQHAYFNLKGTRFVLDAKQLGAGLNQYAKVTDDLPNGYAIFYVSDLHATCARLYEEDVKFAGGDEPKYATWENGDSYAVAFDQDGNPFVLLERDRAAEDNPAAPAPTGFPHNLPVAQGAERLARAWLAGDVALAQAYGKKGGWFDNTRVKTQGLTRGQAAIAEVLRDTYWPHYDRSAHGLSASIEARDFHARPLGTSTLVTYTQRLSGLGSHPFQEEAFVLHVFDSADSVAYTFICASYRTPAMAMELDYTGYPVVDLKKARRFYANVMKLGEGYDDEDYWGYWSDYAVFGLYVTDPDEDGIPRKRQASGYMSFWIRSAPETHQYLKQQKCRFPTIPAINDKSGIDKQDGYTQVVSTDSEGSVVLFTEYTGKHR